ncbi:hypothetical protein BIV57_00935 [Mangrovactinospora gilvigrisea]|uniref:Cobalamin biosynthesis protein CbiX n=1 Tax=Mangrovactinospora gilvigrisea TaxID=1428644 RepID=A0A1J7CIH5_9ACTN|nr:hypothetical protein [Mangrovactinospora gilvigrisea]OIV39434.1 hypothetical protein BIV57_00935 [Mangrovactinospora gilvigrisea]
MTRPPAVIAVAGYESAFGEALRGLMPAGVEVAARGRELHRLAAGLTGRGQVVCVVPMTLGRDPRLVADTARTLLALPAAQRAGVMLSAPFGTPVHLIGWLRGLARRTPADHALLVTAPTGGIDEDAELFRISRTVRQYGRHRLVETALAGGDPDPAEGVRRCRLLGARRVALLPAAFGTAEAPAGAAPADGTVRAVGPLLGPAGLAGVLRARVAEAVHRREHGIDGLAAGAAADHDHGPAHSHGPDADHDHSRTPGAAACPSSRSTSTATATSRSTPAAAH